MIKVLAKHTFYEAHHTRLFWLYAIILGLIGGGVHFVGQLTLSEHQDFQLAFIGFTLRLTTVFLTCVFISMSLIREQTDKTLELILALPIRRAHYYWGKFCGYALICLMLSALNSVFLLLFSSLASSVLWGVFLWFELLIVASCCLFMVFSFKHLLPAICGTLLIYMTARLTTTLQALLESPLTASDSLLQSFTQYVIQFLTWVLPSLDRFSQTLWLLATPTFSVQWVSSIAEGVIFILLISSCALWDLNRKAI